MAVKTWVIGAGGMIGSSIVRSGDVCAFEAAPIPWGTLDAAETIRRELDRFVAWVGDDVWGIVWTAGAGVMRTDQADLDKELDVLEAFSQHASAVLPRRGGGIYVVSSAGGMYAGSADPPFDLGTEPRPLNAYGRTKQAQERVAVDVLSTVLPLTIGRAANVYGPGQSLSKQQGLVTQLALCAVLNRPATIFAPLDTLRDYIYVDDVAREIVSDVQAMTRARPGLDRRIICSGRSTSIAELIAIVERSTARTFPVVHALAEGPYILNLMLHGPPLSVAIDLPTTPLEVGVALVFQDLLRQLAEGRLAHVG